MSHSRVSSQQQSSSIFDDSPHENETKLLNTDLLQYSKCEKKDEDSSNLKWSCCVCTYLNWPKSKHCIQCLTVRKSNNDSITPENEEKLINATKESSVSSDVSESFLASNNIRSPIGSTTNLASSKDIIWNEKGKSKWICHVSFCLHMFMNFYVNSNGSEIESSL